MTVDLSVTEDEVNLQGRDAPALASGASARRPPRLLLTLLGDYWWRRTESLPSAGIVTLLAEFGVSDAAARAALSRLVRNGLLVTSKQGRRTFHRLSDRAAAILDDGARRIFSFGRSTPDWDGMWSVVAFSIPEHSRASRHLLREQLRWLGFAPLYDGVWVSPRDHTAEATERLAELGVDAATVFRATTVPGMPDGGLPQHAWDLDVLRAEYDSFIARTRALRERTLAGTVSPSEALVARTEVMNQWRSFPGLDPELPDELLPEGWPRAEARELFVSTYDALGPLAEHRVRQILARYTPELAPLATHHRSDATAVG
ncbi:PaaX family transcriptional regulator [Gandjariella thermophila]|uniref:PaaX family transcriptional regulator n=1 Tax=Gandjariella thermophila TaxID=1931992 RepID=A0A4D4JGQ9_9PSEU|nr:PaaX family transcriptional regulator C-terminal domain-containing protein [Gandjariella thermophila]GDY33083.1 PaaX family transcriptional regulator [Gandjariella thermophila]